MESDVGHVDGAIKLFAPDYKLESIRPKATGRGQRWFRQGECQRLVLESFGDAPQPLSAARLAVRHNSAAVRVRRPETAPPP